MTTPLHRSAQTRACCSDALAQLESQCSSLKLAVVVSDDGFEVASHGLFNQQGNRLASMANSMQALGDAAAREMKLSPCDYLLIDTADGHLLQRRIQGYPLVLCAVFDHRETVGRSLFAASECAQSIAKNMLRVAA